MRFIETGLSGAHIVELEKISDERGFFARGWCADEFRAAGFDACIAQTNISFSVRAGTMRGMHYQAAPSAEAKVVRCTRGSIFDAIVDLRPDSPTFRSWFGVELTADNHRALFVPKVFAHGFQTLEDDTEVHYLMSSSYDPGAARGLRYDDPVIGIDWPLPVTGISDRDRTWPLLESDS